MRSARVLWVLMGCGAISVSAAMAPAQQVTVGTPFHAVGDSFFEHVGTSWGFRHKGLSASFGSPNMAAPQFGGFDPSAGIHTGFGFQGKHGSGFLNFSAAQGSRQSLVSQTPSITLTNGYPGFISDTSLSPFVIGHIPVVGGYPVVPYPYVTSAYPGSPMVWPTATVPSSNSSNPGNDRVQAMRRRLADRARSAPAKVPKPQAGQDLNLVGPADPPNVPGEDVPAQKMAAAQSSSAGRPVPSVSEARRLHQLEQASRADEGMVLIQRGRTAEEDGKPEVAKVYYRMAVQQANGALRRQAQARLDALTVVPGERSVRKPQ